MKIALILCLALTGCASGQWNRPGGTAADLSSDYAKCNHEAQVALAGVDTSASTVPGAVVSGVSAVARQGMLEADCLKAKGWTR